MKRGVSIRVVLAGAIASVAPLVAAETPEPTNPAVDSMLAMSAARSGLPPVFLSGVIELRVECELHVNDELCLHRVRLVELLAQSGPAGRRHAEGDDVYLVSSDRPTRVLPAGAKRLLAVLVPSDLTSEPDAYEATFLGIHTDAASRASVRTALAGDGAAPRPERREPPPAAAGAEPVP
jgi:hypothetical protein